MLDNSLARGCIFVWGVIILVAGLGSRLVLRLQVLDGGPLGLVRKPKAKKITVQAELEQ